MTKKIWIKIRLNNYKIKLIQFWIIFLCVSIFMLGKWTNAQNLSELNTIIINESQEKKWLLWKKAFFDKFVSKYCIVMAREYVNKPEWDLVFDARKSVFMYMLCNQVWILKIIGEDTIKRDAWISSKEVSKWYIKYKENDDWKIENMLEKKLPNYYNDTEDYIQNLFDNIIASYTTIYQANIYGITGNPEETEILINNFGARYYNYPIDKNTPFVSICATDRDYSFPKTCKKMKEFVKSARNTLNNSDNILNSKAIYNKIADKKEEEKICYKNSNNEYDDKYDMIACWLYKKANGINSFSNLVYNELLFYSTFVKYYNAALDTSPQFRNWDSNNISNLKEKQQKRINLSSNNLNNSKKAINITMKMLMDLQMTFPIHIWLLMYAESVNNFAAEFVKTLTPIYTMAGIFKNVQVTE